jgi:hypothetical protein
LAMDGFPTWLCWTYLKNFPSVFIIHKSSSGR